MYCAELLQTVVSENVRTMYSGMERVLTEVLTRLIRAHQLCRSRSFFVQLAHPRLGRGRGQAGQVAGPSPDERAVTCRSAAGDVGHGNARSICSHGPFLPGSEAPSVRSLGHQIVLEEDAGVAGPDVVAHLVPVQVSASHGAAHTAMAMMA